jgi:hypothetical protein
MTTAGVLIQDGKALLVDPNGNPVQVDPKQASALLEQGYRPEWSAEFIDRTKEPEEISLLESSMLGAGSAATFGLTDIAARAGGAPKEHLQRAEEENPWAYGLGQAAGYLLPGLLTGGAHTVGAIGARLGAKGAQAAAGGLMRAAAKTPMSALTRGGAKVGEGAARAAKKIGLGETGANIARATAAAATEGAGIGAGQMLSHLAKTDEWEPSAIISGAGVGGGLGLAGSGIAGMFRAGQRRIAERAAKKAGWKAPGLTPAEMARLDEKFTGVWTPEAKTAAFRRPDPTVRAIPEPMPTIPGQMPAAALGAELPATVIGRGLAPGAPTIVAPALPFEQTLMADIGQTIVSRATNKAKAIRDPGVQAKKALRAEAKMAAAQAQKKDAAELMRAARQREKEIDRLVVQEVKHAKAEAKAGATTSPKMFDQLREFVGGDRALVSAALMGYFGGPSAALLALGIRPAIKYLPRPAMRAGKAIGRGARSMRALPPAWAAQATFDDYQTRLSDENIANFERKIHEEEVPKALSFGVTPEAAMTGAEEKISSMHYLKERLPQRRKRPPKTSARGIIQDTKPYIPPKGEQLRFLRTARAVEDPASAFEDFLEGRLTREARDVLKDKYPEALKDFQELVKDAVRATTKDLTPEQLRQIDLILDSPDDSSYVKMLQQMHAAEEQQQKPPAKAGPSKMLDAYQTPTQKSLGV